MDGIFLVLLMLSRTDALSCVGCPQMGVTYSPSIWIYIALQRICIATLSCGSLL